MKAISLWQPWAQAVVLGVKILETRSWQTTHRGRVVIHAAARLVPLHELGEDLRLWRRVFTESPRMLPRGKLIGVVDVVQCVSAELVKPDPTNEAMGDFSAGRWAWELANAIPFQHPIDWRGRQRIFDVPDRVLPSWAVR